jgi:hypothetical protein
MSQDKYTVVSTMKNEAPYIIDWVAHYKALGFDDILVCTNDCTDQTVEILQRLQEMGLVTHHPTIVRGGGIHRSALRQASRRYDIVMDAKWVFVCDVDEYLNIHIADGSVQDLVRETDAQADVISIPWRIFGPNGLKRFKDKSVTQQFTKGEFEWDAHERPNTGKFVKSLYTNQHKFQRMGLHAPVPLAGQEADIKWVLPGGADYVVNGARTANPPLFEHAQVNHYALRSMDSFLVKRARGRANHSHHVLGMDYWNRFNLNDERDISINRYARDANAITAEIKSDAKIADLHAQAVDWHTRKAGSIRLDPELSDLVDALSANMKKA